MNTTSICTATKWSFAE